MGNLSGWRVSALMLTAAIACGQESVFWSDPSPHRARFVTVEDGVHLEVLDWGGIGRPIVLLAHSSEADR